MTGRPFFIVWGAGWTISLLFTGNNEMAAVSQYDVILPHWCVLIGSFVVAAFLVYSIILFRRICTSEFFA